MSDAGVLLLSTLFLDLLDPAKKFSLMSQQEDFVIIEMVDQLDNICSWPTPL